MPIPETTTKSHCGVEKVCNCKVEDLRHAESLCYNCAKFKPGKADHCPAAHDFFQAGKKWQVSVIVTQCPADMFAPAQENFHVLAGQADPFNLNS